MKLGRLSSALRALPVVAAVAIPAFALAQQTAPAPPPAAPAEAAQVAPAPPPAPKPFEEIVKLWKGNLSEEFIKRKIESEGVIYQLSADDIIKCKAANVPESIIEAMMKTAMKPVPAPVPGITAPAAPPAPVAPGVAAPPAHAAAVAAVPGPTLAAQADRNWEGMVRRNDGVVLFKSRWDVGKLSFKDEKLTWVDADEVKKNLLIPASQIKEQFLVCLKGASADTECFEWGVKTEDKEYRFRDVGWERSDSKKPQELFDFMKAIYPNLVSARYPADKK